MAYPNDPNTVISDSYDQLQPSSSGLSFPPEGLMFGTKFKFIKYRYALQANNAQFQENINGAHIFLPLPLQLAEQLGISYAALDMGAPGMLFKAGAAAAESLTAAEDKAKEQLKMKQGVNLAMDTAGYVMRRVIGDVSPATEAIIDQATGTVANPYNVATFRNVNTREFTLTFRLIPRSPQDSITIQQIVDNFHYHSLPTKQQNSLFLDMPDEVEVEYYGTTFLYKFARCVITGVSVNYSPYGTPSFFNDGAPTGVELTINLSEIQQLDRSAYANASGLTDSFDYGDDNNASVNGVSAATSGLQAQSTMTGD